MDPSTPNAAISLLPAELAGHTVESLYALHGPEKRWTYWLVLGAMISALTSLPLIQVDVSVRAPGMVRPLSERTEIKTIVSGRIQEVRARENDTVAAGQVLLVLASGELDEQIRRQTDLQQEKEVLAADLQALLAGSEEVVGLRTAVSRHEWTQFRTQLDAYRLAEAKAGSEFTRYAALADRGIATRQELDNARYEVERLKAEARLFREQTRARWAARLKDEQSALDDLVSTRRRLDEERTRYTVRAPATGVLMGFGGWRTGTQMLAGQTIGIVSPADALRVETQVSPRNIGLVRVGQPVRLQVDAYPYTEWGTLDGVVEAISGDIFASESSGAGGFFKVMIRPAVMHLSLATGVRGRLEKGLTLTARFVVARRSLLQVLYDDASAWLNPQDNRNSLYPGHP